MVLPGGRNSGLWDRLLGSQALGLFHVLMSGVEKGCVLMFQLHWLYARRTKV